MSDTRISQHPLDIILYNCGYVAEIDSQRGQYPEYLGPVPHFIGVSETRTQFTNAANAAAFTPTDMKPVKGVGAPS